jgi:hypothetical protein
MLKFFTVVLFLSLGIVSCNAQILQKNTSRKVEKELFGKSRGNRKEVKAKESRKVIQAKKKQEARQKKLKSDYDKSIVKSKKRTVDIQTPEVQKRMKQNKKDTARNDRVKRKKNRTNSKKAGNKYK